MEVEIMKNDLMEFVQDGFGGGDSNIYRVKKELLTLTETLLYAKHFII